MSLPWLDAFYVGLTAATLAAAVAALLLQRRPSEPAWWADALALAAVGFVAAFGPGVFGRIEYRLTRTGLERRPLNREKPGEFQDVCRWRELAYVLPTRHGFKFYKPLNESNPLRRLWNAHLSDAFSGEIHADAGDRDRVVDPDPKRSVAETVTTPDRERGRPAEDGGGFGPVAVPIAPQRHISRFSENEILHNRSV